MALKTWLKLKKHQEQAALKELARFIQEVEDAKKVLKDLETMHQETSSLTTDVSMTKNQLIGQLRFAENVARLVDRQADKIAAVQKVVDATRGQITKLLLEIKALEKVIASRDEAEALALEKKLQREIDDMAGVKRSP